MFMYLTILVLGLCIIPTIWGLRKLVTCWEESVRDSEVREWNRALNAVKPDYRKYIKLSLLKTRIVRLAKQASLYY